MRDKLYKYVIDGIEYMIAFMPSLIALILSIHYNISLETLNTQKGLIVVVLIVIQWLIMFILAIHEANKRPDKFIEK